MNNAERNIIIKNFNQSIKTSRINWSYLLIFIIIIKLIIIADLIIKIFLIYFTYTGLLIELFIRILIKLYIRLLIKAGTGKAII